MSVPYTIQTGGDGQKTPADFPLVTAVVAGTNVTVDNTDPTRPVINASGGGGGGKMVFCVSSYGATGVTPTALLQGKFAPISGQISPNISSASDKSLYFRIPCAGTFKNFTVSLDAADDADNVYTVYKNGVATALVATIATGQSVGTDSTHSFAVAAGDNVVICATTFVGDLPFGYITATIEFDPS